MSKTPTRLGRGLASLIGDLDENAAGAPARVRMIPIGDLEPGPFQPRRDMEDEALEDLAASIETHGLLQPILARPDPSTPDRYQIVAGERRWRASGRAGLATVPVIVRALDDVQAMAAGLIENLQRVDLNAIEEAEGFRRLMSDFGFTQDALSRSIGKSRSHVANTLRLLGLPVTVQDDVRAGSLTAGHARALLGHPDPAGAARTVVARGLNVRQTEALGRAPEPRTRMTSPATTDPNVAALEKALTEHLGLAATVTFDGMGGRVTLHYRTLDQLDGLTRLLLP